MTSRHEIVTPASRQGGSPRRVLVVEDNSLVAAEIVRMVTSLGCDVAGPIGTLSEAMDFARRQNEPGTTPTDVALLDVNISNEQVYPLAERLLEARVPLVFVTAYTKDMLPDQFQNHACLEKPFTETELQSALEHALTQPTPP